MTSKVKITFDEQNQPGYKQDKQIEIQILDRYSKRVDTQVLNRGESYELYLHDENGLTVKEIKYVSLLDAATALYNHIFRDDVINSQGAGFVALGDNKIIHVYVQGPAYKVGSYPIKFKGYQVEYHFNIGEVVGYKSVNKV